MSIKEKRSFLLMIYMFSFIIMLFGVAFSYFTARTRSESNAVEAQSGHLTLTLEVAAKYADHSLIPMDDSDVMKAYNNKCVDDYGKGACSAYDITVINTSVRQDIVGTIDFDVNHIENLSYMVLDEQGNIYQNITKINKSTKDLPLGNNFILDNTLETKIPTKKSFTLLIWLSNYDYNQEEDKNGTFTASITYNSVYGQRLSSAVSGVEDGGN